jgi:predicted NAD/FAD-binding protein
MRTEAGHLLGGRANTVENLAQGGSGMSAVFHNRFEDVVKQASPGVCGAMDLESVY